MSLTDYAEELFLSHALGFSSLPSWTPFLALFTTAPNEDGTGGVEVSGNNYSRIQISSSDFSAIAQDTEEGQTRAITSNVNQLVYPYALGGDWGAVVGLGIFDAVSDGNLIWYQPLSAPLLVVENRQVRFDPSDLSFTFD